VYEELRLDRRQRQVLVGVVGVRGVEVRGGWRGGGKTLARGKEVKSYDTPPALEST
jgi:hypothetical protein